MLSYYLELVIGSSYDTKPDLKTFKEYIKTGKDLTEKFLRLKNDIKELDLSIRRL